MRIYNLIHFLTLVTVVSALAGRQQFKRPTLGSTSFSLESARHSGICVKESQGKGLGAFTKTPISAGAWIGEYTGEFLTRNQVKSRYWGKRKRNIADRRWIKSRRQRNQGLSGDYLFDMGDDIFIDGEDSDLSSWCRFMNHASDEKQECNVETRSTRQTWDGTRIVEPRLWYVAMRDIKVGEELLYDYGDCYWD